MNSIYFIVINKIKHQIGKRHRMWAGLVEQVGNVSAYPITQYNAGGDGNFSYLILQCKLIFLLVKIISKTRWKEQTIIF